MAGAAAASAATAVPRILTSRFRRVNFQLTYASALSSYEVVTIHTNQKGNLCPLELKLQHR